jgi:hypothetical protein
MMHLLEKTSDIHRAYFVDLYVRASNARKYSTLLCWPL